MTRIARDFTQEISEIRNFLLAEGWQPTEENSRFSFYRPPSSLEIKGTFTIGLPAKADARGADVVINDAVKVLQELYGHQFARLFSQVAAKSEIVSAARLNIRFVDERIYDGGMPLGSLRGFVDHVHKGLYQSAKMHLDGSSDGPANSHAAEFADDARFLQTEVGSFVARIEVPYMVLKQSDLFGTPEVTSHDVCSHLLSGISFLNDRVLAGSDQLQSDSLLSESINLFDPGLLEEYEKMLISPQVDSIDFQMQIGGQRRQTSTGQITEIGVERLREFASYFRQIFTAENEINIVGMIVELRSRDPSGNRNFIRVVANLYGDRTYFSVPLTNEEYQVAVDAHRRKMNVRVLGTGTRLKTQVRVNTVTVFEPV